MANGRCPQLLSCRLLIEERAGPHPAILSCPGVCKGQPCSAQPQREGAVKRPRGPQPARGDATPPQTAESKVLPRGPQPGGTCSRGALRTWGSCFRDVGGWGWQRREVDWALGAGRGGPQTPREGRCWTVCGHMGRPLLSQAWQRISQGPAWIRPP